MDQERPKADRPVGRRVAKVMERVLTAGAGGKRLRVEAGPEPSPPSLKPEQYDAEAFVRQHLGLEAGAPLGEWIEPSNGHEEAAGGKSAYVRFNRFWREWMQEQDADSLAMLTVFGKLTPEQVGALKTLIRRELERTVKAKIWRNARRIAIAAALGTFAVLHWGAEQITFLREKGPLLKELWQWLSGLRT